VPFKLELERRTDYLLLQLTGPTTVRNMTDLAATLQEETRKSGIKAVLLDCAGMTGALPLHDLFSVGTLYAELIAREKVRLAAIHPPPEWRENQFSENVIQNRGGTFHHFDSVDAAEAWFRGTP
jgi:hypothetical protein